MFVCVASKPPADNLDFFFSVTPRIRTKARTRTQTRARTKTKKEQEEVEDEGEDGEQEEGEDAYKDVDENDGDEDDNNDDDDGDADKDDATVFFESLRFKKPTQAKIAKLDAFWAPKGGPTGGLTSYDLHCLPGGVAGEGP